jgi:DNA recombination protein RmuC
VNLAIDYPWLPIAGYAALLLTALLGWLLAQRAVGRLRAQMAEQGALLLRAEQRQEQLALSLHEAESAQRDIHNQLHAERELRIQAQRAMDVAQSRLGEIEGLQVQLRERTQLLDTLREQLTETRAQLAVQVEQQRTADEKLQWLEQARQHLGQEFESIAAKLFEERALRFGEQSKQTLDTTLAPFREQLAEFRRRVDHVYERETQERLTLKAELGKLHALNQQMSHETLNLTRALKGQSKIQGNWGELILERLLEESGLTRGREYDTQVSLKDEDGRRRNPDVVIHLPEQRDIVIDAKVSLVDYERYHSAEDAAERAQALKRHVGSVRSHVEGLSLKAYERLEGVRSLDFVFIFIPIEAAFMLAMEHDDQLFRDAWERNIVVVSPTTLLVTLRTVHAIWRYEQQNRNAERIADAGGKLHDQFVLLTESLSDIGRHIDKARGAYDQTLDRLSRGRGNLVRRIQQLQQLGARTRKQLAHPFTEDDDASTENDTEHLAPPTTGDI